MKFRLEFKSVYFQTSGSTINGQFDGLVVSRITVQLCYGYLWVALGSKVLKLTLLSIKENGFCENSCTLGGPWPPGPPLNPRLCACSCLVAAPARSKCWLWRAAFSLRLCFLHPTDSSFQKKLHFDTPVCVYTTSIHWLQNYV